MNKYNLYIEKTISGIIDAVERTVFSEKTAHSKGLLQSLDPRTKVLCVILFILSANLTHNIYWLCGSYIFLLIIGKFSSISLKLFITRIWLVLPFFAGFVALPLFFNFYSPGTFALKLIELPKYNFILAITYPGVITGSVFLLRVANSLSAVTLLKLTTSWGVLLKALSILGIPDIFLVILQMTYRYIFIFLETLNNLFLARKSRIINIKSPQKHWLGLIVTTLFNKTVNLSEEVYIAMISRGYQGNINIMSSLIFRKADYVVTALSLIVFMAFFKWFR